MEQHYLIDIRTNKKINCVRAFGEDNKTYIIYKDGYYVDEITPTNFFKKITTLFISRISSLSKRPTINGNNKKVMKFVNL